LNISTNKNKIGFFDSGVGGLTVYEKFRKILPSEDCVYFGDLKHLPYGNKTKDELIQYTRTIFGFFQSLNVKSVVMACNTSSAAAYSTLCKEFDFKIYPIIQSCAKIIAGQNIDRLGIFATESTINSGVYESEIHKYNPDMQIYSQSCPQWVNIVESRGQNVEKNIEIIKKDLDKMLKNEPDKIILGCTHYPYLTDVLARYTERERFIDPAKFFVEYIKSDLQKAGLINPKTPKGSEEFFVSANPESFKTASKMFYDVKNVSLKQLEETVPAGL